MPQIIGNLPNQVPTNADLGTMAYREANQFYDVGQTVGFRNRIINGDMRINQRSFSGNAGEFVYILDRWITFVGGANQWSVSQNAGSVTPPPGFTNYLGITSLAATTPASGDRNLLCQMIEGFNIADWAWGYASAKPITLSFWVRSSLTGTFGAAINSTGQEVSATFSYTINAANTWEYKTIIVQGPTTNPGYWNTTNGRGLWLFFDMGTSANFALDTTWGSSAKYTIGSSRTNVIGTNGATWYLTGVQVEVGSTATSFDYRTYGTELALCHRYYYRITAQNAFGRILTAGLANSSTLVRPSVQLPTPMRTSVSAVDFGGSMSCYDGTAVFSVSNVAIDVAGINTIGLNVTTSGTTGKQTYQINDSGSGGSYIGFSAEL
jgi:hypothetical protein